MNIRIPKQPILVLDDEEFYFNFYKEVLEYKKIPFLFGKNGQEGLDLIEKNQISIFIVDLEMPVMDGKTFIAKLKEKIKDPIIIVQTGVNNPETIIEIMKLGIFDYIMKPTRLNQILGVIAKALEYKYLKENEEEHSNCIQHSLKAQLEWLNYKEGIKIKENEKVGIGNLYHLHQSLLQGGGVGAITTLIDFMKNSSEESGNKMLIDTEVYQLLISNANMIEDQVNSLYNTVLILDKPVNVSEIKIKKLIQMIPNSVESMNPILNEKKMKVTIPEINSENSVNVDLVLIKTVWEELLLNAIKYGNENTIIDIYAFVAEGYMNLTIKNIVNLDKSIPTDKEKLVLEPFIRLLPPVESLFRIEKYGMGLGLTMVDAIVKKHGGFFKIHTSEDHSYEKKQLCTLAELHIPILEPK